MAKDNNLQQEAIKNQQKKSKLEQKVTAGIHGGMELKKDEKNRFLGEFRERVLQALTFDQVKEAYLYSEVVESIKDAEAKKLIINRNVSNQAVKKYIAIAQQEDLSFKKVSSPDYKGEVALVVVSDHAVHKENIFVQNRSEKLQEKGIPLKLINVKGEKICTECYQLLAEKAPEELENYTKFSWLDKLLGADCPGDH